MAGYYQREVLEPSGKEKVALIAALIAGLAGMYFALAYSYVYINCACCRRRACSLGMPGTWRRGLRRPCAVPPRGRNAPRVSRREGGGIRRIAPPAGKNK